MFSLQFDILKHTCCNCQTKNTMTAVVKLDKTSGLDKNDSQKCLDLQRTLLIRKGSIKYCLLLLWARLKIFDASHYVMNEMSVCMCVKQQTNDLYIIICNCIYIVVINCGWNNNVTEGMGKMGISPVIIKKTS